MPELQQIPFALQTYKGRSSRIGAELLQNMYVEKVPEGRITKTVLIGIPGMQRRTTFPTTPIRGMQQLGDYLFVVSGNKLYRVDENYNVDTLEDIAGSGAVDMTANKTHVAIITNTKAYAANFDETLQIDLPEGPLVGAAYQDGYGLFCARHTEDFYISGLDDMTTIAALDVSNADTFADHLVTVLSDHREVWLFGKTTIEVWHNVGNALFPFQRSGSGFMERGIAAAASAAKADNNVYWLGDDLQVYTAASYQPQVISTPAIAKLIAEQSDHGTARAFIYSQEGHSFYVLTFAGATLVYDITTGLWATRVSFEKTRWRAESHAWIWNKNFVGDFESGNLYELKFGTHTENANPIQRRMTSPPIHAGGRRVLMDELVLEMQTGVGLTTGQGSDPQVMLDFSDDGNRTWSNELWRSAGKIGEYTRRVKWYNLGSFRERTLRITITDPVEVNIMGAFARMEALSE